MTTETRKIPEEVCDLFETGLAHADCRDACLKSIFSARRAVGHAKASRECYRKAWNIIYDLWPETVGAEWSYDFDKRHIFKVKVKKGAE